jgi:hypothetical protein
MKCPECLFMFLCVDACLPTFGCFLLRWKIAPQPPFLYLQSDPHTSTRQMKWLRGIFNRKRRDPQDEVHDKATSPPLPTSPPGPEQRPTGLSPTPESQPQKSDKPSDAWRVAKTGLTLSLELAEAVAGALPIPGVQIPFTIALRIIKGINVGCLSLPS